MTIARDQLRERWRLKAVEAAQADDRAARAKEGKAIFLDQLIETLIEQAEAAGDKLPQTKAERMARTSDAYKSYLRKMHDARHAADILRIEAQDADRRYWEGVSAEATWRAEARMTQ
jgi:hypothetical protein